MSGLIFVEVAYVTSVSVSDISVEWHFIGEHHREEVFAEVEFFSIWYEVEDVWFEDIDAGVDGIGEHLSSGWFFEEAGDMSVCVSHYDAILEGCWVVCE